MAKILRLVAFVLIPALLCNSMEAWALGGSFVAQGSTPQIPSRYAETALAAPEVAARYSHYLFFQYKPPLSRDLLNNSSHQSNPFKPYLESWADTLGGIPYAVTMTLALAGFVWLPLIFPAIILMGQFSDLSDRRALGSQHRRDERTGLWLPGILEWKDAAGHFIPDGYLARQFKAALYPTKPRPLSGLWIDLDGFGTNSRARGKAAGDAYMKKFGELLRQHVRGEDLAIRMGPDSDEFFILLPETDLQDAQVPAALLLEKIRQLDVDGFHVTASIGVAQVDKSDFNKGSMYKTIEHWWRRGDEASNKAKQNGKDQMSVAHPEFSMNFSYNLRRRLQKDARDRWVAFTNRLKQQPQEPLRRTISHAIGWSLLLATFIITLFHFFTAWIVLICALGEALVRNAQLKRLKDEPLIDEISKAWRANYLQLDQPHGYLPSIYRSAIAPLGQRKRTPHLSVLLVGLDFLKAVNAQYDHLIGNQVLEKTHTALVKVLRPEDKVVRVGANRFLILLHHTNEEEAQQAAVRVRGAIGRLPWEIKLAGGKMSRLTATILVSQAQSEAPASLPVHEAAAQWLERLKNILSHLRNDLGITNTILLARSA